MNKVSVQPELALPQHLTRPWLAWRGALRPVYWLVAFFVVIAVFAPWLATHDPLEPDPAKRLQPPSAEHWFGTDSFGMDVYSRVLYATRTDFSVALAAIALAVLIGVPLGAAAGYHRGLVDDLLTRLVEVIQAFPLFLFAMVIFAAVGSNTFNLIAIIAFINIPIYLKLVRSVVLPLKSADFVLAARCAGNSTPALILNHILPNALGPVFAQFSLSCAYAIQLIAGLSFIGLGVKVPHPEWGSMIQLGASHVVFGRWWPSVFPGLAVFLAVFTLNRLGHRVRDFYTREA
ncbi:MAG: ABC transporter permease [Chloroflexota bacterium]|nr:MAG: ABC transporter permease [Chloroflexota bacterium]